MTSADLTSFISSHSQYTIKASTVATGASISNIVTSSTKFLNAPDQPSILILSANKPASNKLISIVEIVKRTLKENGGENARIYQYTKLYSEVRELEPRGGKKGKDKTRDVKNNEDEDEPAFERLRETKLRAVPCLTIFLSTTSVADLKDAYGPLHETQLRKGRYPPTSSYKGLQPCSQIFLDITTTDPLSILHHCITDFEFEPKPPAKTVHQSHLPKSANGSIKPLIFSCPKKPNTTFSDL
ncbi:MAG: hypothetical protein M1834_002061 [Cirrosporium novae-zelandiae]|nr:MAG: hypothetical protein M1834_002061 [Cirrosporium novae-zelandiae]